MTQEIKTQKKIISPLLHVTCIIVSLMILTTVAYNRLSRFRSLDSQPTIHLINSQLLRNYQGVPHTMNVGLHIENFTHFNVIKNNFALSGVLWFSFTPGIVSLNTLQQFEFMNATITSRSEPKISLVDEKFLVEYRIKLSFSTNLSYQDFPFDDHRIYLILINNALMPNDILFHAQESELIVTANTAIFGWNLVNKSTKTGYISTQRDAAEPTKTTDIPVAIFAFDYSQFSTRYIISLLLPLLLLFYLALFSFSLPTIGGLGVTSGVVTALLAYRFVIDTLAPDFGSFMIVDHLFLLSLSLSITAFILEIVETYQNWIPLLIKKMIVIALHIIVIVRFVYLIHY